jgi:hypothetical protein
VPLVVPLEPLLEPLVVPLPLVPWVLPTVPVEPVDVCVPVPVDPFEVVPDSSAPVVAKYASM